LLQTKNEPSSANRKSCKRNRKSRAFMTATALNQNEKTEELILKIDCCGNRPAEDLTVTIQCVGSLLLARPDRFGSSGESQLALPIPPNQAPPQPVWRLTTVSHGD
jgi:hypothetical protein